MADAELQVGARGRETGRPAARGRGTTSTHVGVGASSGGGVDQGGGDNRWGAGGIPGEAVRWDGKFEITTVKNFHVNELVSIHVYNL